MLAKSEGKGREGKGREGKGRKKRRKEKKEVMIATESNESNQEIKKSSNASERRASKK